MPLTLDPNLPEHDVFYAELLATYRNMSEHEAHAFNARLIMILANHVGDLETLRTALATAKR